MASTETSVLEPGPSAFYGMRKTFAHLLEQAKFGGRDWYWIDNSYFDVARERQFRITKNAIQYTGRCASDGQRFAALGIEIKPMRANGATVVIAAQSQEFMALVGDPGWLERTRLRYADSYVIVRNKQESRPLAEDLKDARLLVTWSSAAAVTALLEGVPVECSPQCCAYGVGDRVAWAHGLADRQWSTEEIAAGDAWKVLNA